jgi:hypothetical protein
MIISVLSALTLASCSGTDETESGMTTADVAISLKSNVVGVVSRSISTNLQNTNISTTNPVGIYIYDQGNTTKNVAGYGYENYQYTADANGVLTLGSNQQAPFYSTSQAVDIYGYAPRFSAITTGFTTAQPFAVKDDQSADADYVASDLIYGAHKTAAISKTAQSITFTHKLSKVNVTIVADGTYGFTAADLSGATVRLKNVAKSGTMLLTDGTFTPSTTAAKGEVKVFGVAASNTATSVSGSAVIVPQTFANSASTSFIEITLANGTVYQYVPTADITFDAATQYNYTITMKNAGISVTSTITPWSTSTDATGDANKIPTFNLSNGDVVNISDNGVYIIKGTSTDDANRTITISGSPTVTLDNVTMESNVALNIVSGSPTIIIKGTCKLTSNSGAGLQISSGSVTINGTGTLNVTSSHGPAIGNSKFGTFSDITINNITVVAKAIDGSAAIGTYLNTSDNGSIHIYNADVDAKALSIVESYPFETYFYPAAIGLGVRSVSLDKIVITTQSTKDEFMSKLNNGISSYQIGRCSGYYGSCITNGITLTSSDGTYISSDDGATWTKQ